MKREEYVETLVVNGRVVPVGRDDYGHYFFEYAENGELKTSDCGTHSLYYRDEIQSFFDVTDWLNI